MRNLHIFCTFPILPLLLYYDIFGDPSVDRNVISSSVKVTNKNVNSRRRNEILFFLVSRHSLFFQQQYYFDTRES